MKIKGILQHFGRCAVNEAFSTWRGMAKQEAYEERQET